MSPQNKKPLQAQKSNQKQRKNSQNSQKPQNNQKPAVQPQQKAQPRQQRPVFANIRKEFNFTDDTQRVINDAICKQAKEMESATPSQPQVLKIGKDTLKLTNSVHPEFINFGLKVCSNERAFTSTQRACLEFCVVFIRYAETFDHLKFSNFLKRTDFCAAMIEDLKNQMGFLRLCTSFGIAMGNIIRYVKSLITSSEFTDLSRRYSDSQHLTEKIRTEIKHNLVEFMQSRLVKAAEIIKKNASTCILSNLKDHDTVLIYKSDPLVLSSLVEYFKNTNKYFTVIVVDDLAHPEGCAAYRVVFLNCRISGANSVLGR